MTPESMAASLCSAISPAPGGRRVLSASIICAGLLSLAACGGGGDGGGGASPVVVAPPSGDVAYTAGVFQPYKSLASQCGSAASQNNWLRSWTNDTYLWYGEVPDRNPNLYPTPDYFDLLKTSATTASGTPKDQFHFTYSTAEWEALSQSGVSVGYGAEWFIIRATPPREIRVAYVAPGSAAAVAGVRRGDTVITVNGADAVSGNTPAIVDTLNAGLFPDSANQTHQLSLRSVAGADRNVALRSANVTSVPVQNVSVIPDALGPVGYMLFNDHIATAETGLINAINTLKAASVTDLVLDIRYNGGGYLDLASELAFMIAGPSRTSGQHFERLTFNDKYTNTDPVTGRALTPTPFHTTTGFSAGNGNPLPTLNLNRVFVLTGSGTCSASESIINSLRGVDIEVIQIGGTTCGKPYGFYPTPNCGTTYFAIQFKGVNAKNFGDYADGFSAQNTLGIAGERIPGCSVRDDFSRELGDVNESRLAAALAYRASSGATCPPPPSDAVAQAKGQLSTEPVEGIMHKSPWRENRILRQ